MIIDKENDTFVQIENKYIKDGDDVLDDESLTILTLLNVNKTVKNNFIFSISWIMDMLKYSENNLRKRNDIKNTINYFIENNIIKIYTNITMDVENMITDINTINKNTLLYGKIQLEYDEITDGFTMLYDKELFKIIDISKKYKLDTYSLIRLVLYLFSCINCNKDIEDYCLCYPSFKNISDEVGISETTIEKYITILQYEKIIDYDYAGYKETAQGKVKNGHMFYSRYMDRNLLIERVKNERIREGFIKLNKLSKDKSNMKRSISQMINKLNNKNNLTDIETERLKLLEETYNRLNNGYSKEKNSYK